MKNRFKHPPQPVQDALRGLGYALLITLVVLLATKSEEAFRYLLV
ncbi:hypothetical protein ACFL1C_00360 [Pseudomonadota bacterium]